MKIVNLTSVESCTKAGFAKSEEDFVVDRRECGGNYHTDLLLKDACVPTDWKQYWNSFYGAPVVFCVQADGSIAGTYLTTCQWWDDEKQGVAVLFEPGDRKLDVDWDENGNTSFEMMACRLGKAARLFFSGKKKAARRLFPKYENPDTILDTQWAVAATGNDKPTFRQAISACIDWLKKVGAHKAARQSHEIIRRLAGVEI